MSPGLGRGSAVIEAQWRVPSRWLHQSVGAWGQGWSCFPMDVSPVPKTVPDNTFFPLPCKYTQDT